MRLKFETEERAMYSRSPVTNQTNPEAQVAVFDPSIESYLDSIDTQLRGLPAFVRAETRRELRSHLTASIAAGEELGETHEQATEAALARFGTPSRHGKALRTEWTQRLHAASPAVALRYTTAIVFATTLLEFGAVWGLNSLCYEWRAAQFAQLTHTLILGPHPGAAAIQANIHQWNAATWKIVAESAYPIYAFVFFGMLLLSPILQGRLFSRETRRQSGRSALIATLCLISAFKLASLITGWMPVPHYSPQGHDWQAASEGLNLWAVGLLLRQMVLMLSIWHANRSRESERRNHGLAS